MATVAHQRPHRGIARGAGSRIDAAGGTTCQRALGADEFDGQRHAAQRRRAARPAHASVARAAALPVGRPRLAKDIPLTLQRNPDSYIASLALLLLDAGILPDEQLRRQRASLPKVCRLALNSWLAEQCKGLQVFKPCVSVRIGSPYGRSVWEAARREEDTLHLECYASEAECLVVGPGIERLEAAHRELGGTALMAMSKYGWRSCPVFQFDDQLSIASYTMWAGGDSVEDSIRDFGLDEEEAKHQRAQVLDRSDILQHTPEWVFKIRYNQRLQDGKLRRIAERAADPFCRAVATTLLALEKSAEPYEYLQEAQESGGEFVGFGAVLRWSANDHTVTVLESLWDMTQQGGEGFESFCYHGQRLDDAQAFRALLANLSVSFATLRLLDQLIAQVANVAAPLS